MPNYDIDVSGSDPGRGFVAVGSLSSGTSAVEVFTGRVGGALLGEVLLRLLGAGTSVAVIPAGFELRAKCGGFLPLASMVDVDAVYQVDCGDPAPAGPWATLEAIKLEIEPAPLKALIPPPNPPPPPPPPE